MNGERLSWGGWHSAITRLTPCLKSKFIFPWAGFNPFRILR